MMLAEDEEDEEIMGPLNFDKDSMHTVSIGGGNQGWNHNRPVSLCCEL